MPKKPEPVELVLCEGLHFDVQAGKMSLVGVFNSRRFVSFPTPIQQFTVYAGLQGGEGQGTMRLTVSQADTEADLYQFESWRGFSDPDLIVMYEGIVRKVVFPEAGRYIVTLRFDGEIVADRILDVFQE